MISTLKYKWPPRVLHRFSHLCYWGSELSLFFQFEYLTTMIIYGKNDPQYNLECKFVHQNQNLCAVAPLTPHNATPGTTAKLYVINCSNFHYVIRFAVMEGTSSLTHSRNLSILSEAVCPQRSLERWFGYHHWLYPGKVCWPLWIWIGAVKEHSNEYYSQTTLCGMGSEPHPSPTLFTEIPFSF